MELVTGHIGWIEVICGPMFSGKSEELIRRLRSLPRGGRCTHRSWPTRDGPPTPPLAPCAHRP